MSLSSTYSLGKQLLLKLEKKFSEIVFLRKVLTIAHKDMFDN